jgi:hypothetical protein
MENTTKELVVKREVWRTVLAGTLLLIIAVLFIAFAFLAKPSSITSAWKIKLLYPLAFYLACVGITHFLISIIELNKGYILKVDDVGIDHFLIGSVGWKNIQSIGTNTINVETKIKSTKINQFSYLIREESLIHLGTFLKWSFRLFYSLRRQSNGFEMVVNLAGTKHTLDSLSKWIGQKVHRLDELSVHATGANLKF